MCNRRAVTLGDVLYPSQAKISLHISGAGGVGGGGRVCVKICVREILACLGGVALAQGSKIRERQFHPYSKSDAGILFACHTGRHWCSLQAGIYQASVRKGMGRAGGTNATTF